MNRYLISRIFEEKNLPEELSRLTSTYLIPTGVPARWRKPYLQEIEQQYAEYSKHLILMKMHRLPFKWTFQQWCVYNGNDFIEDGRRHLSVPYYDWGIGNEGW